MDDLVKRLRSDGDYGWRLWRRVRRCNQGNEMTDMTPVAWMYEEKLANGLAVGTGCISFHKIPIYGDGTPLYTADQLKQARADALREAADYMERNTWASVVMKLRRMADEMEGK